MVAAFTPVDSSIRRAARPVGAQQATVFAGIHPVVQGYQRLLGHGLAGSGPSRQDGQRAAHSGEYCLALLVVEGHPQFRPST